MLPKRTVTTESHIDLHSEINLRCELIQFAPLNKYRSQYVIRSLKTVCVVKVKQNLKANTKQHLQKKKVLIFKLLRLGSGKVDLKESHCLDLSQSVM